jgi:hypothetical protein
MSVAEMLAEIERRGGEVVLDGRGGAIARRVSLAMLDRLRARRPDLLAFLRERNGDVERIDRDPLEPVARWLVVACAERLLLERDRDSR